MPRKKKEPAVELVRSKPPPTKPARTTTLSQAKNGRPVVLNDEIMVELATHLRNGLPVTTTCTMVGISRDTYKSWVARGKAELARLASNPKAKVKATELLFAELVDLVGRSRAEFEAGAVARIGHAGQTGAWQADAWLLTRLLPKRYAPTSTTKVEGDPNKPIEHVHAHTFLAQARQVFSVPPGAPLPMLPAVVDLGVSVGDDDDDGFGDD